MLQDTSIIRWKAYETYSSYQNKINDIIQLQFINDVKIYIKIKQTHKKEIDIKVKSFAQKKEEEENSGDVEK